MMPALSSLLFVPADDERRIETAHQRNADVLILDLEDAVAPDAKSQAREALVSRIALLTQRGAMAMVRINSDIENATADLNAIMHPSLKGVVIPKSESPRQLEPILAELTKAERRAGLEEGAVKTIVMIESPRALPQLSRLARLPRLIGIALGSEDFSLELGVPPSPEALDLPCRMIALAAAATGVSAYGTPISIGEIKNQDAFRTAAEKARAYGMSGALCVHPAQVQTINEVFSPTATEIKDAAEILRAWEKAGEAGVIKHNGRMIDRPVAELARRLVEKR